MARKAKENISNLEDNNQVEKNETDISTDLIKSLNKEIGSKVAYNLAVDESPTHVKRWISTGSYLLDYILSNRRNGGIPEGRIIEISGPPSCHGIGEEILMFDGTTKKVEEIKIGDQLMGPDSKPRNILNIISGQDEIYKLTTRWGDEYKFNSEHILALNKFKNDNVAKISIKNYLNSSNDFKKKHLWFQPENGIEFNSDNYDQTNDIDPYIFGLFITNGNITENKIEIPIKEKEIANVIFEYSNKLNHFVGTHKINDEKKSYYIRKKEIDTINQLNFYAKFKEYNLNNTTIYERFIPNQFKITSRNNRLNLLAGILDKDGYLYFNNSFEYKTRSKKLAEDVQFIARSIGIATTQKIKSDKKGLLYRIYLFGNVNEIPTKIQRKQAKKQDCRTQYNRSNFKIENIGIDKFIGFTVDSDNLYLSSKFGVIHNCGKSHIAYQIARTTQQMGGLVVYIDTENATPVEKLAAMGLDVSKKFVYCDTHCTEEVFSIIESTIIKAKSLLNKDIPILVIWDSVAATSPKAELDGEYEKDTIGLQARVLSKGMRKITGVIGQNNVTLILLNQTRMKIGCVSPDTEVIYRKKI